MSKHGSWTPSVSEQDIYLGKCWAAVDENERVIKIIRMATPESVNFDVYREKALELLKLFGEVKSGHLVKRDGRKLFIKRLTHQNRSKSGRLQKEYSINAKVHID